ncbi:ABC transporter permease [[Clostridium] sordellii]|nr:binding--dependent transport system inner membrane component family protein [[Clostridium] sordellii VPI 9048] [Paeniclostridium sordellii VPI 9048]MBW4863006.1 ABC transporter permease [Paeniclostridium sp.]MBX9181058.1 ABC transporter permease [Paeniclostridium sordellii]MBW4873320.1 ABC transporter permease [Paeniclostridium sp.]MCH1967238.1 ABC transporter permease [Paeniclostridium sordellii]
MEVKVSANTRLKKKKINSKLLDILYKILALVIIIGIWQISAEKIGSSLLLPMPMDVFKGFITCITDPEIVKNVIITLQRVLKGFMYALIFGLPLGLIMGFSSSCEKLFSPLVDSARQVPIMAWVPLTIVWFGIGDGPTIFLIAFAGVFPIILNTIQGVRSISKDYYNAAKSMGASPFTIFTNVMLPAALPDILTGARLAISTGWMSVI